MKTTYKDGAFPKRCSCGAEYTREAWQRLTAVGFMEGTIDGLRFYDDLEMRNCSCRSTLAIAIASADQAVVKLDNEAAPAAMTRLQAIMELRRIAHDNIEGRITRAEKDRRIRTILTREPELPLELVR